MKRFAAACLALGLSAVPRPAAAEARPGNLFVLAQLKTAGGNQAWDPYPLAARDILSFLEQTTSVKPVRERRIVTLADPELFRSPFLLWSGSEKVQLTAKEKENLKNYLSAGGFLFAEDRSGERSGAFDHSFRNLLREIFPGRSLDVLPREHAVFRSFYLLRTVAGRRQTRNNLEGLEFEGRTALIYSQNDVLGAWAKDLLGNYLFDCRPGGEAQRWEAQKLMMNVVLYSVTGTYKTDSIHLPFIERKLQR